MVVPTSQTSSNAPAANQPPVRLVKTTQTLESTAATISAFTYELKADGLFYKNNVVFPSGLAANLVTSFTFPTGALQQDLITAPYFITVHLEAINPDLGTSTVLEKTIYLENY